MVVDISSGEAKFNKDYPVIIRNPVYENEKDESKKQTIPQNLIILDANGTVNDLKEKNTMMILNRKNFLTAEGREIEVYPLTNLPEMKITKESLQIGFGRMQPVIKVLPYILCGLLLFAIYCYLLISKAFYLITVALILWGFAILVGKSFKFATLYQFAIHAMTIPVLIEACVSLFPMLPDLSLLFPILNVAIAVAGLLFVTRKNVEE
jgi:hypothetical protein